MMQWQSRSRSLELCVFNDTIGANLDLKFHHVTAGRCTDHAGTNIGFVLANDPTLRGVFRIVIDDFFRYMP